MLSIVCKRSDGEKGLSYQDQQEAVEHMYRTEAVMRGLDCSCSYEIAGTGVVVVVAAHGYCICTL